MTSADAIRIHAELAEYGLQDAVRARMREFLGDHGDGTPSAAGLAAYGGVRWLHETDEGPVARPPEAFAEILDEGADLLRSVGDSGGALLVLDVELVSPADPLHAQRDPASSFARLATAHAAAQAVFARHGVDPLVLLTAAGYRYVVRVPVGGRQHETLEALGRADRWGVGFRGRATAAQNAHRAAGRVVEFLAHQIVRDTRDAGGAPVALADVPPAAGVAYVRVDPTAYADPMAMHFLRVPFASDQTVLVTQPGTTRPFLVTLPCPADADVGGLLAIRTDLQAVGVYARQASARIPDLPEGASLVEDYRSSELAAFHFEMDLAPQASEWAGSGAGLFDPESAPPCANTVLRYPSPRLLQPRHLRTVALAMWSVGWHPRSVAALVRARFEEPHEWGTYWRRHDPTQTAEYYVRLFCGSAAAGLDDGRFTCETQATLGLCPPSGCGYMLGPLFERLRALRARNEAHA